MRKELIIFFVIIIMVLMPAMALYSQTTSIVNGDFEAGDYTGWTEGGADITSGVQSNIIHNGSCALKWSGDFNAWYSDYQDISVTNGQKITFVSYINVVENAANKKIGTKLECIDGYTFAQEVVVTSPTAGWIALTNEHIATADAVIRCHLMLWGNFTNGNIVAYFDDVSAPGGETPPPPSTNSDNLNVIVSIFEESIGVDFIATEYNFGTVSAGTVNVSSGVASIISNSGTCNEIYSFQITDPSGWSSSTTAPGADTFVLNGALSVNVAGITWSAANHALSTTLQICTLTKFAGDENGVGVASGSLRHLWLQFMAPTSSTIYAAQTIPITVSAEAE